MHATHICIVCTIFRRIWRMDYFVNEINIYTFFFNIFLYLIEMEYLNKFLMRILMIFNIIDNIIKSDQLSAEKTIF